MSIKNSLTGVLLCYSPMCFAAEALAWKSYLLIVMAIALVLASWLSYRNKKVETGMAKLLLTGLYFWVFTFAQLILLSLIHYFTR